MLNFTPKKYSRGAETVLAEGGVTHIVLKSF